MDRMHNGYKLKWVGKSHPRGKGNGMVKNAVLIVESILNKRLPTSVVIHHVDKNRLNDSNDNLVVCQDKPYHNLIHRRDRAFKASDNPHYRRCWICGKWDNPKSMYVKPNNEEASHLECRNNYLKQWRKRGDVHCQSS